jgi:signal transduction histidine kinase
LLGISLEDEAPKNLMIEDLIHLPEMTEPYKLAAMQLLVNAYPSAGMSAPELLPKLVFTAVKLCLEFGNSATAPVSYVFYGLILVKFGDIHAGYRLGELAIKLLNRFDSTPCYCGVHAVFNLILRHWKYPIRETIQPAINAMHVGLETGDVYYASCLSKDTCTNLFLIGEDLDIVAQKQVISLKLLQKLKQQFCIYYTGIWYQLVLNLRDLAENRYLLVGEGFDETKLLPKLEADQNKTLLFVFYLAKAILFYFFEDYERSVTYNSVAREYVEASAAMTTLPTHNFYESLALLAQYLSIDLQQQSYLQQIEVNQEKMGYWADHAPQNFRHKYDLVEAERYRVLGNKAEAIALYDRAIAGAKANGYIQEEALANELAAKFYLHWGKEKIAQDYLTNAYYGYAHWGALAKIQDLERRYSNLLAPILPQQRTYLSATETVFATGSLTNQTPGNQSSSSGSTSLSATLDLTTVLKASQTLSSEIQLDKLLATLLHTVLENAGADKGALLMPHEEKWFVEAVATLGQLVRVESISLSNSQEIPHTLINTVKRSLQPVVIVDAAADLALATDVYVMQQQPKSVLCTPILQQGKLVAILYLENHVTVGAFTRDRIETLQLLTRQAAIALENARLYQKVAAYSHTLEAEVERKTQALHQQNQALEQALQQVRHTQAQLIHVEKMSSLGQMVGGIAHEINNPVNFIKGNIEYTKSYFEDLVSLLKLYQQEYPQFNPKLAAKCEEIDLDFLLQDVVKILTSMEVGSDRISQIVLSLKNFARLDEATLKTVDIHEGIESTLLIVQHRCQSDDAQAEIRVVKDYGKLPAVTCYPSQLNQVFLHIINNGIDAIRENSTTDDTPEIRIRTGVTENGQIAIQIANTNSFIPVDIQRSIFDPFFTTKSVGDGAGLGLSVSYGIIQKHHGRLTVRSQQGKGTEFQIIIPQHCTPLPETQCF